MIADLTGSTALITGAGQGIGRGIALVMAGQGADIAVADLPSGSATDVAKEVEALGRKAIVVDLDVTDKQQCADAVARVIDEWGRMDILVNNAGVAGAPGSLPTRPGRDVDWEFTWQVNVKGVADMTEAALPHLKERRSGKIVNTASVAARAPLYNTAYYATTKMAVIAYTQAVAKEMAPYNVNVNAVCPGRLYTAFHQDWLIGREQAGDQAVVGRDHHEVFEEALKEVIPLGREQAPEDIGAMVAFLASESACNITGQSIQVDGGQVMV
jgi:meso-butanediol dehydrogenase/(S,S)-butanediol dehydrogenase/diacetyl reductase